MARRAAFEALPGRQPVTEEPLRASVVERSASRPPGRGQPDFGMAAPTEDLSVVAGRALDFVPVCVCRMALQEVADMERRRGGTLVA